MVLLSNPRILPQETRSDVIVALNELKYSQIAPMFIYNGFNIAAMNES